jgi:hypothetical protein
MAADRAIRASDQDRDSAAELLSEAHDTDAAASRRKAGVGEVAG